MLPLIPWLAMTLCGAIGWRLGRPFGFFTGALGFIIGAALGFYYGRKLRMAVTP